MSESKGESVDPVVQADPSDDIGAETLARFRYQTHLAAAKCIAMLIDGRIRAVICEWHEDYVVQFAGGPSEIVSVKHHEGDQPNWTVRQLCRVGGLKHLFDRYVRVGEKCTCRLQTNEQLRPGPGNPGSLRDACNSNDPAGLDTWASTISGELGADVKVVRRFLESLTIEDGLPDRRMIETVYSAQLVPKLRARMSLAGKADTEFLEAIRAVVEKASSSPGYEVVLDALADPAASTMDAERSRTLAAKTVDRARLVGALLPSPTGQEPLLSIPFDPHIGRTRLVKKLEAGGVGPTDIHGAQRLRSSWKAFESDWTSGLPGDEEIFEDLRTRVVLLAGMAERKAVASDARYGRKMLDELGELVAQSDFADPKIGRLSPELLMGIVFERTEACEVYWSQKFDADAVP